MRSPQANHSFSYIGVDPGTSGALAFLTPTSADVFDVPVALVKQAGKKRKAVDRPALLAMVYKFVSLAPPDTCIGVIEKVGGMPRQAGVFNFGRSFGLIEMAFTAAGVPCEYTAPGEWKDRARLIGRDKSASRQLAAELFPHLQPRLVRVCDDGRAEALLIAHFWRLSKCQ